ncbi:MAG TPA: molybdopterin-binding protein, partial [Kaistia sp.]|nr:molybdopterin-binding protein [Kaistia sp.]
TDLDLIGDDLDRYAAYLHDRHQSLDVIVTTGGVSGSDADYTVRAVEMAGGKSQRIALAVKPGKPFAFGRLGNCSVVSLPGNPMAALVGALLFVRPPLLTMSGVTQAPPPGIAAQASATFVHRLGRTEFVPAIEVGISTSGIPLIRPVRGAGSARLMPLSLADGLAVIPAGETDIAPGGSLLFHRFGSDFAL